MLPRAVLKMWAHHEAPAIIRAMYIKHLDRGRPFEIKLCDFFFVQLVSVNDKRFSDYICFLDHSN